MIQLAAEWPRVTALVILVAAQAATIADLRTRLHARPHSHGR